VFSGLQEDARAGGELAESDPPERRPTAAGEIISNPISSMKQGLTRQQHVNSK
jgi:hypothetical protein